jgi:hypothetical protein
MGLWREQVGGERDDIGLRDGLAVADRQRTVGIRRGFLFVGYQAMALHSAERCAYRG